MSHPGFNAYTSLTWQYLAVTSVVPDLTQWSNIEPTSKTDGSVGENGRPGEMLRMEIGDLDEVEALDKAVQKLAVA